MGTQATVTAIVVVIFVVLLLSCFFGCFWRMGGKRKIRRWCNCANMKDEKTEDRKLANTRVKALQHQMGEGTYVGHGTDTVGTTIHNPWSGAQMSPAPDGSFANPAIPMQNLPGICPAAWPPQGGNPPVSLQPGTGWPYPYPPGGAVVTGIMDAGPAVIPNSPPPQYPSQPPISHPKDAAAIV